ncbi:MAG: hypothetical protein ACETWK_07865 [Candidatus Aminicenantaceae bacterium]
MSFRIVTRLFLIFQLVTVLSTARGVYMSDVSKFLKNIPVEVVKENLIRKNLLFEKSEKLNPPVRNIFSPHNKSISGVPFISEEIRVKPNVISSESMEETSEGIPEIRYIGYIDSGQKIIGLIIFKDETLAVEEGEIVTGEMKVGRISPKEIEILGPNSKIWKFSLEGGEG